MSFPAMKFGLGSWEAYQVNIETSNLISFIKLSDDVFGDTTIDNAMQRKPDLKRAKVGIGNYINRNEHRFFNSLVIATVGGEPHFDPITIDKDDPYHNDIAEGTFGVLKFSGKQKYYALDGQHRLVGIKEVLDPDSKMNKQKPRGFEEEIIPVILVVQPADVDEEEFRRRYRRLFGNLNRNQKATSTVTNIIMDEDNLFNILTRRLIIEHPFFRAQGDDIRVKTNEGKALHATDNFFTSIETLNQLNTLLLTSKSRNSKDGAVVKVPGTDELLQIMTTDDEGNEKNFAWKLGSSGKPTGPFNTYTLTSRPSDDVLDCLYTELEMYWDAILETLPFIENDPINMRQLIKDPYKGRLKPSISNNDEVQQNALFRPVFQEVIFRLIRDLFDVHFDDDASYTKTKLKNAISGLKKIDFSLFSPPFRGLLFHTQIDDETSWTMRNEGRAPAQDIVLEILTWMLTDVSLDKATIESYKLRYRQNYAPQGGLSVSQTDGIWKVLREQRKKIQP